MASVSKYEKLLDNPMARRALDIIAASENADYNTTFGGGTFDDFSRHPNIQRKFKQKDGTTNSSGAAGRYQFLKKTWDDLRNDLGLKDFSPRNQDIGALALLDQARGSGGKSALELALEGNYQGMVEKAGNIWASFPSAPAKYSQPKHGWNKMNKIIASATGKPAVYEDGDSSDDAQQGYALNYENPAEQVLSDPNYQESQAALFMDAEQQAQARQAQQAQQIQNSQPVSVDQVASVQQTPFTNIPAMYEQAIVNAFSDGDSNELFEPEVNDALRGVFDVA
nr:MAG TPA: lysozyme [Caudoviricetes sp.]